MSRLHVPDIKTLDDLNVLPPPVRDEVYLRLVPPPLLAALGLPRARLLGPGGHPVRITAPDGASWARVEVRATRDDRDPALLLDLGMSGFGVLELSLVQVNDPRGPRFAIDHDEDGQDTLLGTVGRNRAEERRALGAGLAPGQVRRGLRMLGPVLEAVDGFCRLLGHEFYLVEPLFYHSAVLFERQGCAYFLGRERMEAIDARFRPGGDLHAGLDGSSPFRQRGFEATARGRSWAVHDGILGEPWEGIKMFRAPGAPAAVRTFPDGRY